MNWKLLEELVKDRAISDPKIPQPINVGSCWLHIVHRAFKIGTTATGWHIDNLLKSMWCVFSDSPAKKDDYMKVSTTKKLPLSFCATRWVEDVPVAERAIVIWTNMKMYISQICAGPKSKILKNHSIVSLQGHVNDPFIKAKLQFFVTVAKIPCPFLEVFQSKRPILQFMAEYLQDILQAILERLIKKSVMDKTISMAKLER